MPNPTPAQARVIRQFNGAAAAHDGHRPPTQTTYGVCERNGWIEQIDAWPYHRTTQAGADVIGVKLSRPARPAAAELDGEDAEIRTGIVRAQLDRAAAAALAGDAAPVQQQDRRALTAEVLDAVHGAPLMDRTELDRTTGGTRVPEKFVQFAPAIRADLLAAAPPADGPVVLVLIYMQCAVVGPFDSPQAADAWWGVEYNRLAGRAAYALVPTREAVLERAEVAAHNRLVEHGGTDTEIAAAYAAKAGRAEVAAHNRLVAAHAQAVEDLDDGTGWGQPDGMLGTLEADQVDSVDAEGDEYDAFALAFVADIPELDPLVAVFTVEDRDDARIATLSAVEVPRITVQVLHPRHTADNRWRVTLNVWGRDDVRGEASFPADTAAAAVARFAAERLAEHAPVPFQSGIVTRPGYVAGWCGHAVAGSEWRAGFRVCEQEPEAATLADRWPADGGMPASEQNHLERLSGALDAQLPPRS